MVALCAVLPKITPAMVAVADSGIVRRLSNQPGFTAGALDDLDAVVGGAAGCGNGSTGVRCVFAASSLRR